MYFIIESDEKPLRWLSTNEVVRYGSYNDALIDFHPQENDFIIPIAETREEALKWLDKYHGVEFDAGEVVYLYDDCVAEYDKDKKTWYVYPDDESLSTIEIIKMEGE